MDGLANVACLTVAGSGFLAVSAFESGDTQENGASFLANLPDSLF